MDDKLVRAKVHTAVQQHCATSGVQPNPYLAQRVLAAARDEGVPVVKKKLSLGLVFILILLLIFVLLVLLILLLVLLILVLVLVLILIAHIKSSVFLIAI